MATLFYDHLIDWQKFHDALTLIDMEREEQQEIIEHAEHILHTEVLVVFVTHLPRHQHEEFLQRFYDAPHDKAHWEFIKANCDDDVEAAVRQKSDEVLKDLLEEILEG